MSVQGLSGSFYAMFDIVFFLLVCLLYSPHYAYTFIKAYILYSVSRHTKTCEPTAVYVMFIQDAQSNQKSCFVLVETELSHANELEYYDMHTLSSCVPISFELYRVN